MTGPLRVMCVRRSHNDPTNELVKRSRVMVRSRMTFTWSCPIVLRKRGISRRGMLYLACTRFLSSRPFGDDTSQVLYNHLHIFIIQAWVDKNCPTSTIQQWHNNVSGRFQFSIYQLSEPGNLPTLDHMPLERSGSLPI